MKTLTNKKGLTNMELSIFLAVALLLVGSGILFFYSYTKSLPKYGTEYVLLDDNFIVLNMSVNSNYLSFSIQRTGGFEDYKGFQIFFEDDGGKVVSQEVYTQIEIGETRTINLNYRKQIGKLRYVTLVPIY